MSIPPPNAIPTKTLEGVDELQRRTRKLGQRYRNVLLLVDGQRTVVEVLTLAARAGVSAGQVFDELITQGLISVPGYGGMPKVEPLTLDLPPEAPAAEPLPAAASPPASRPDGDPTAPTLTLRDPDLIERATETWAPASPDSTLTPHSALGAEEFLLEDESLERARAMMLSAARAESAVSRTLLSRRIRKAQTRLDILNILEEMALRNSLSSHPEAPAAGQALAGARDLLTRAAQSSSLDSGMDLPPQP